jgi:hypothetical protein
LTTRGIVEAGVINRKDVISIKSTIIPEASLTNEDIRTIKTQHSTMTYTSNIGEEAKTDGEGGIVIYIYKKHTTKTSLIQRSYIYEGAVGDGGG